MANRPTYTADMKDRARALKRGGASERVIAKQLKVAQSTVNRWISEGPQARTAPVPGPVSASDQATITPQPITFSGGVEPVAAEAMPDFSGLGAEDQAAAPVAAPAPAAAPPPAPGTVGAPPPPPATDIEARALVDTLLWVIENRFPVEADLDAPRGPPKPPQPFTEDEKRQLAVATVPILQKYGGSLAQYAVEINFAAAIMSLAGPRVSAYRDWKEYQADKAKKSVPPPIQSIAAPQAPPAPPERVPMPQGEPDYTHLGQSLMRSQMQGAR